jgi:hypothetical protein
MSGTGDVEHVEVASLDDAVQVNVDEVLAGRRAPVPHHQRLHMRERQRLAQQRVVVEIDLADRQIIGRPPVGVDQAHFLDIQRELVHRLRRPTADGVFGVERCNRRVHFGNPWLSRFVTSTSCGR